MQFDLTPEEARPVAIAVAGHFLEKEMSVEVEIASWDDAPYRTSLLASKAELRVLIEAQGDLDYHGSLKQMALWLSANKHYAELYIATNSDAGTTAKVFGELKRDGVGLLIVDDAARVVETIKPRNSALVIRPDPTLHYGQCKNEVNSSVTKFNQDDRKDGLRDMCEIVERETKNLGLAAARRGGMLKTEAELLALQWSTLIDVLASANSYTSRFPPLVSNILKADLHSFRGARNLVDHPARGRRAEMNRQKQFAERMMMGTRLVAELVSIKRRVR